MTSSNKKEPIKLGTLNLDLIEKINGLTQANNDLKSNDLDDVLRNHPDIEEFKLDDSMDTKTIKPFDFKTLKISLDEVKKLSDEELLKLLSGEGHDGLILDRTALLISNELLTRQIKEASKPHWTIKPAFFLLIATLLLTAIPTAKTIYDFYLEISKSKNNHANKGEEIKTNSKP